MIGVNVDDLKDQLRREEGKVLKVYRCPAGKLTIGYGHNIEANPLGGYINFYVVQHGEITDEMAEYLLEVDLAAAINNAKKIMGDETWEVLSPARRGVLVMMVFQMGSLGLIGFTNTLKAIRAGDHALAASNMRQSAWYTQTTARAERLIQQYERG